MTFDPDYVDLFLKNFNANKEAIRAFPGCQLLELYRDKDNSTLFFTYSYWASEEALDRYRKSELFKTVWSETKQWFKAKPEAWSLDALYSLK